MREKQVGLLYGSLGSKVPRCNAAVYSSVTHRVLRRVRRRRQTTDDLRRFECSVSRQLRASRWRCRRHETVSRKRTEWRATARCSVGRVLDYIMLHHLVQMLHGRHGQVTARCTVGKLILVDLAGSERVKKSGFVSAHPSLRFASGHKPSRRRTLRWPTADSHSDGPHGPVVAQCQPVRNQRQCGCAEWV